MFAWDPTKAERNRLKHGVSFAEASSCFEVVQAMELEDTKHSVGELRWIRIAKAESGRVLVVAFTRRRQFEKEVIRIISARQASSKERAAFARQSD